jgi:hypothetical protein
MSWTNGRFRRWVHHSDIDSSADQLWICSKNRHFPQLSGSMTDDSANSRHSRGRPFIPTCVRKVGDWTIHDLEPECTLFFL